MTCGDEAADRLEGLNLDAQAQECAKRAGLALHDLCGVRGVGESDKVIFKQLREGDPLSAQTVVCGHDQTKAIGSAAFEPQVTHWLGRDDPHVGVSLPNSFHDVPASQLLHVDLDMGMECRPPRKLRWKILAHG